MYTSIRNIVFNFFPSIYRYRLKKLINNTSLESLKSTRKIDPEVILLQSFLDKESICFDIGAYRGLYSFQMESLINPNNLYIFEPISKNYNFLKKVYRKSNVFDIAISDKKEKKVFKIPIINNSYAYTRATLNKKFLEINQTSTKTIQVQCSTIDDFMNQKKLKKIDFIKIDVEGHEFNVLKGGINSISNYNPVILIEIEQRHHSMDIHTIFEYILELNYSIQYFDLDQMDFIDIDSFKLKQHQNIDNIGTHHYINNFFCIPK